MGWLSAMDIVVENSQGQGFEFEALVGFPYFSSLLKVVPKILRNLPFICLQ